MALELEEEKKAQAEREKRLQEQAKKIENLSSMVLCSNKNENHDIYKKVCDWVGILFFPIVFLLFLVIQVLIGNLIWGAWFCFAVLNVAGYNICNFFRIS